MLIGLTVLTFKLNMVSAQSMHQIDRTLEATVERQQKIGDEKRQLEQRLQQDYIPKAQYEQEIKQKDQEIEKIKVSKAAEKAAQSQIVVASSVQPTYQYNPTGTKEEWMRAAGIPESVWWAVDYIVSRESGWRPCSYYPSKNNCNMSAQEVNNTCASHYNGDCAVACGLGMSLPCGKWGSNWTDPVNQLKNMSTYVNRYGGWAGAVSFWKANSHY